MIARRLYSAFLATLLVVTTMVQLFPVVISAATPALYFDPGSVSVLTGGQITVKIRANGTNFNAAQLNVTYDPGSLEYVSYSVSGSALPNVAVADQSSGAINIATFNLAAATGDGLFLSSYTFKALKSSGSSTIGLAGSSSLQSNGTQIASGGAQLSVAFTAPSTTAPSTPPPTTPPPTSTAPPPKTTPTTTTTTPKQPTATSPSTTITQPESQAPVVTPPTGDVTAPKQKSLATLGFANEEIQIKIITDEPSKSIVKYGKSKDSLLQTASTDTYETTYFVPLGEISKAFSEGETCYYVVETFDAAGNKTTSTVRELPTTPVQIKLLVKNKSGKVLGNTTVIINGREFTTDSEGNVIINGILPGLVVVSLKQADGGESTFMGELTAQAGEATQSFEITPAGATKVNNSQTLTVIAVGTLSVLLGVGGGLLIIRRLSRPRYPVAESMPVYGGGSSDLVAPPVSPTQSNIAYHPQAIIEPTQPTVSNETPRPIDNNNYPPTRP